VYKFYTWSRCTVCCGWFFFINISRPKHRWVRTVTEEDVKEDIRLFFQDPNHWAYRYGSPTPGCNPNSPYHRKQIEVLFEKKYFHWVTSRTVNELIGEGFIKQEKRDIVHFVYRADAKVTGEEIYKRIELIKKYSAPAIVRGVGAYAELLYQFLFRVCGFEIVGENTNEYAGRIWTRTNHNLDYVVKKGHMAYGVEIKNTLDYMENDEFEIKLEMCKFLNLTPFWIVRSAPKTQFEKMRPTDGIIFVFKTQIYPPTQEPLVREMWETLRLPVTVWKRIPENAEKRFLGLLISLNKNPS